MSEKEAHTKSRSKKDKEQKSSDPIRLLLPDAETQTFWKLTAADASEYAIRVAKFSRAMNKKEIRTSFRSHGHRWHDIATATQKRRPTAKVLVMPIPSQHSSISCSQEYSTKAKRSNGGENGSTRGTSNKERHEVGSRTGVASDDVSKSKAITGAGTKRR